MPTAAEQYNDILGQLGQYQQVKTLQGYPSVPFDTTKMPSRQSILKRIDETRMLLKLLEEVDSLLAAHPDLERLIGTLAKLGQL